MSDEPTPELRALADTLFAAGRAERPSPSLGRRLQLIDPRLVQREPSTRPDAGALLAARSQRAASSRLALALSAAALLAGGIGLWRLLPSDAPIRISAESTSGAAQAPAVSAPAGSAPVLSAHAVPPPAAPPTGVASGVAPAPPRAPASVQKSSGPSVAKPPPAAPRATLHAELERLAEARSALRSGDAAQALDLLDRHDRERPGDTLVAEATLLRIEALSVHGQPEAASELAARFVRDNPHNALSDRAKTFIRPTSTPP